MASIDQPCFVMVMMFILLHSLQPVFLTARVRQNIQKAVPRMITEETICSRGSADSAVNLLLIYIPPKAISHTTAVCDNVAATPSITA